MIEPVETSSEVMSENEPVAETAPQMAFVMEEVPAVNGRSVENVDEPVKARISSDEIYKDAEVKVYDSGDSNMIMIKKYLLTFIDASKITESDDMITITVEADEYDSVMANIRANEYVQSVTEATFSNGTVIINIR